MSHNLLASIALVAISAGTVSQNARSAVLWGSFTADEGQVNVLVRFRETPDHVGFKRFISTGAHHRGLLASVNAHLFSVDVRDLELLARDPDVELISADNAVRATGFSGTPDYGWMTAFRASDHTVQFPYTGKGIGVAIIDSGISPNDDLTDAKNKTRIVYNESFVPGDASTADAFGHGTHVAGIIAGNGSASAGSQYQYTVRGIAPGAQLINLRVLDKQGAGTDSSVIAAISRAIQLQTKYNIRVINLSLGRPVSSPYKQDLLCQAVENAWRAGIVVVVSAGNEGRNNSAGTNGYGTITAPGNDPYVITVGAMNTVATASRDDDKITSYSSKGPTLFDHVVKPDLVAPGNRIISLRDPGSYLDTTYASNDVPVSMFKNGNSGKLGNYYQLSGTSMAAPMVSGAALLLCEEVSNLTPDQIKARLMKTASKFSQKMSFAIDPVTGAVFISFYDMFTVGAGYLDIPAALANTDPLSGSATSPFAHFDPPTGLVSLVDANGHLLNLNAVWGSNVVWGSSALWGTNAVWGSSALWGTNVLWGSSALWGTNVLWGNSALWGTNVLWGSSALWGTNVLWGSTTQDTAESSAIAINGEQ